MNNPCAILATDVLTPLGADPDEVWARMMHKTCGLRAVTRFPLGKYQTDVAGELASETEALLQAEFPRWKDARAWCMALHVARRCIEQAGVAGRTGLVLATTKAEIGELERLTVDPSASVPGRWNPAVMARDVAAELDLTGPAFAVSNACASGLVALVQAARMLERGDADLMLVIGVDVLSDFVLSGFSALAALSPRPCRPYDASRDGLSLGEGAGALLLGSSPTSSDRALGNVIGWAVTDDANHITGPSRTGDGLRTAIIRALEMAGRPPSAIDYINGHGTGTRYNDDMESKAFHAVFGGEAPPLSSMKGYIGHTLGAAGVIEAALCLVAMREGAAPASLGMEEPGTARPINVLHDHRAVKNFTDTLTVKCGFGGVNAAVVLTRDPKG